MHGTYTFTVAHEHQTHILQLILMTSEIVLIDFAELIQFNERILKASAAHNAIIFWLLLFLYLSPDAKYIVAHSVLLPPTRVCVVFA